MKRSLVPVCVRVTLLLFAAAQGACTAVAPPRTAQLASSRGTTCARMTDGTVRCWGAAVAANLEFDRRFRGEPAPRVSPAEAQEVPGLTDVVHLAVGPREACALQHGGIVRCWSAGLTGLGVPQEEPPVVATVEGAVQVSVGENQRCVRMIDGTVRCWTSSHGRPFWSVSATDRAAPMTVPGLRDSVQVESSGTSCACVADGTVRCWGCTSDSSYQCTPPSVVEGTGRVTQVAMGAAHQCALSATATVLCWGENHYGQLGLPPDSFTHPASSRTALSALRDVAEVAAGDRHTCARTRHGTAWCWGANERGQLGSAPQAPATEVLRQVPLQDVVELSLGGTHSCARVADGGVLCWGSLFGDHTPVRVTNL